MYYLAFFLADFSVASVTIASVLVGASQGAFFVMWQSFYASEGTSRTTVYIPLSALCSVVLCIAIGFLPTEWLVVCGVIVLPALGAWTLRKSLAEVVPYEAEPLTRERRRMLLRDMGRPVFCVCAIGFVWKMIGYVVPQGNLGSFEGIMLGMSCATLVVAAIELFTARGFDMLRVYQVIFPLITGVFLLPTFFGIGWLGAVSVFTMFGFEVVNLLLLITCAAYASRKAIDSSLVYALCVAPTLVSLLLGDAVGQVAAAHTVLDFTLVVDVLFVCVYVLTAALFLASLGRNRSDVRRSITAVPQASVGECDFEEALAENAARAKSEEPLVQDACAAEEEPCVQKALSSEGESRDAQRCEEKSPAALRRSNDAVPMVPTDESSGSLEERLSSLNLIDPLSVRECEVADLMRHGNTVAAIARRLYISENTVRGHTKSIYRKLGIHSKQELIDLLN